jgi:hypothetical protein
MIHATNTRVQRNALGPWRVASGCVAAPPRPLGQPELMVKAVGVGAGWQMTAWRPAMR